MHWPLEYRTRLTREPVIADPDDPDEISFSVDDILDVLDKQGKWWLVQSADGSVGSASSPSSCTSP